MVMPRYSDGVPSVLLPESLRAQLPLLGAQRRVLEPMVYTRFWVPDGAWQFYVTEGEPDGTDYRFYGLLMASEEEENWNWQGVRLSDLVRMTGVVLDPEFVPGTFPDAVPHP
jgi:hypothetical protein